MKKQLVMTIIICAAVLIAASVLTGFWKDPQSANALKIGFVYSEDESTPYTANFVKAQRALEDEYGSKVEILVKSNVLNRDSEQPMRDLIQDGVKIIFINMDSDIPVTLAWEFPEVQFCQASMPTISIEGTPENYHTFNGEIYQARYVAGIVAGMKLREMIDSGAILPENAIVGYVAANNSAEVVSGYTAFLLGIRNVAPEATMRVRYTGSWSNFQQEKAVARTLIDEGCVILSHHTNTMAPAIVCEEVYSRGNKVYFVGYHQSMMDVAPSSALVSIRTNWVPYVLQATEAVMRNEDIEKVVSGNLHGNDISAGFEEDWVQMLELNKHAAAEGTEDRMNRTIASIIKGKASIFSGKYTGVNPDDPSDTIDLSKGFTEHRDSSSPSFRYILKDVITEDN